MQRPSSLSFLLSSLLQVDLSPAHVNVMLALLFLSFGSRLQVQAQHSATSISTVVPCRALLSAATTHLSEFHTNMWRCTHIAKHAPASIPIHVVCHQLQLSKLLESHLQRLLSLHPTDSRCNLMLMQLEPCVLAYNVPSQRLGLAS